MAVDSWSSIAWQSFPSGNTGSHSAWYKHNVPYKSEAHALQNLEIWIPSTSDEAPAPSLLPKRTGLWVIYIHGGAWRDPLVDSTSFQSPVEHLLKSHPGTLDSIAGIVSLNYSLSPHPHHPTHPSPPKDPKEPVDPSRQAMHPDHIVDVLTGLAYLQQKFAFGSNYILLGHSCGATLAFQVTMNQSKWGKGAAELKVQKPKAVVGLNGLYDLPDLITSPGDKHAPLVPVYEAFTRLAFGNNDMDWYRVSPRSVQDWSTEWSEGVEAVLVQSKEDSLVPYKQTTDMLENLFQSKSVGLTLRELEAGGDHNELWQNGERLAQIISIVMKSL